MKNQTMIFSNSFKKSLSFVTFSLMIIYVFGLVNIEYKALGIPKPLFEINPNTVLIFDAIFWTIVCLLTLELVIAYLKMRDAKKFLKKYWLEVILLVFMPIFVGFKIFKITLKTLKQIKVGKSVFKIFQKVKKK